MIDTDEMSFPMMCEKINPTFAPDQVNESITYFMDEKMAKEILELAGDISEYRANHEDHAERAFYNMKCRALAELLVTNMENYHG